MEFERVKEKNRLFDKIWGIYEETFPIDERRCFESQLKILDDEKYRLYSILDKGCLIGFIGIWDLRDFMFGEHFAIKKDLRDKGFGKRALKQFLEYKNPKLFVGETEILNTDIQKRRIKFYERIGFKVNNYDYIQPAYDKTKKPVRMVLISYPRLLNKSEFENIRRKVHKEVYGYYKPVLNF